MFSGVTSLRPLLRFSSVATKRFIAKGTPVPKLSAGCLSEGAIRPVQISSPSIYVPLQLTDFAQICISPHAISVVNVPLPQHRREIVDPLAHIRYSKEPPPLPNGQGEISLPQVNDVEKVDPVENTVEKRAARLIVIRRAKMKKHKWRKLQKKMKFVFARRRQRRELKKEKAFQALLLGKIKEAEKFEVETFIGRQLDTAHWERPITHVRGFRAPEWVIKDHLREQDEIKRINSRIEECLRFRK